MAPPPPEPEDGDDPDVNQVEIDLDDEFNSVLEIATEDEIVDLAGGYLYDINSMIRLLLNAILVAIQMDLLVTVLLLKFESSQN